MGKPKEEEITPADEPEDTIDLADDEEEDEDDEEDMEMFDPQEITDCLRSDDGQSVGESFAKIAGHLETQNKILLKILSAVKSS